MEAEVAKMLSAGGVMAIGAVSSALGEAWIAGKAMEGMARNPEVADKLFTNMIVGMALDESTAIYCLVISLIILFVL